MPRRIDYACRFEFLREAAFAIVRDRGVAALSRRALADELGLARNGIRFILDPGADLAGLAANEVVSRRRTGRFGVPDPEGRDPLDQALLLVGSVMPCAWSRVDEELVWLRIAIDRTSARSPATDPEGPLRERVQVAEWGYVREEKAYPLEAGRDDTARDNGEAWLALVAERETAIAWYLGRALEQLDVADARRSDETAVLRAVADGLTWAVCTGRLMPDEARAVMTRHLEQVRGRHSGLDSGHHPDGGG